MKVPVIYFYEDFAQYEGESYSNEAIENLNYSFLAKLFTSLSEQQKEKILQVLKNSRILEKTG